MHFSCVVSLFHFSCLPFAEKLVHRCVVCSFALSSFSTKCCLSPEVETRGLLENVENLPVTLAAGGLKKSKQLPRGDRFTRTNFPQLIGVYPVGGVLVL